MNGESQLGVYGKLESCTNLQPDGPKFPRDIYKEDQEKPRKLNIEEMDDDEEWYGERLAQEAKARNRAKASEIPKVKVPNGRQSQPKLQGPHHLGCTCIPCMDPANYANFHEYFTMITLRNKEADRQLRDKLVEHRIRKVDIATLREWKAAQQQEKQPKNEEEKEYMSNEEAEKLAKDISRQYLAAIASHTHYTQTTKTGGAITGTSLTPRQTRLTPPNSNPKPKLTLQTPSPTNPPSKPPAELRPISPTRQRYPDHSPHCVCIKCTRSAGMYAVTKRMDQYRAYKQELKWRAKEAGRLCIRGWEEQGRRRLAFRDVNGREFGGVGRLEEWEVGREEEGEGEEEEGDEDWEILDGIDYEDDADNVYEMKKKDWLGRLFGG